MESVWNGAPHSVDPIHTTQVVLHLLLALSHVASTTGLLRRLDEWFRLPRLRILI